MSAADADFASLVEEAANAIARIAPPWRVRLGDAEARWRAEGVRTGVLERAIACADDPGTDALLETFARTVARLRVLERQAAAADPSLAGAECFRDPERLREAAATAREAAAAAAAAAAPPRPPAAAPIAARVERRRPVVRVDAERWVLAWPTADGLLLGDAA